MNELLQTIDIGRDMLNEYKVLRHYYLISGYIYKFNDDYYYEPSVLVKFNEMLRYQADISTKLYYRDEYWGGLSYRTNGELIFMMGVQFQKFYIAYSFDYGMSKIIRSSFGSHEFNIGYKIGYRERKLRWRDRYF